MTRAIVLAAGEGTRLRPYSDDRPKSLVALAGATLLERHLTVLRGAGVDVTVVTGYRADQIEALGVATRHNPAFDTTNMVASLFCASDLLDGTDDVVVAYGDILYEPRLLTAVMADERPVAVAIDTNWRRLWSLRMDDPLADAETLKLTDDGMVQELGQVPTSYDDIEGQYMGLIHIRAEVAPAMVKFHDELPPDGPYDGRSRDRMFMTSFIQCLIDDGMPVGAALVDGGWIEVDTVDDLERYEALAASGGLDEFCRLPGGAT